MSSLSKLWNMIKDIKPIHTAVKEAELDDDLVFPMDYKYGVGKTATQVREEEEAHKSPWNVQGGINIHIPTAKDTMKYGKSSLSASWKPAANPSWANYSITSSYVPSVNWSGVSMPLVGKSISASYVTTASWSTGGYSMGGVDITSCISGRYAMPVMDATLNVTVNIGDPTTTKATVGFKGEELSRMVWLNNNVDVVRSALVGFNELVVKSSGAGKPWFNCVAKGVSSIYESKRITFHGLSYDEHVIKACLMHHVDIEGQDPMKVLTEVATTHQFFVVGDMEVDEDEGKIEEFVVSELWMVNPQTKCNELIFRV